MKEYFQEQINNTEPLTEEVIEQLTGKTGSPWLQNTVQSGDKVLYFIIERPGVALETGGHKVTLEVVKVLERELDEIAELFEYIRYAHSLPVLKEK